MKTILSKIKNYIVSNRNYCYHFLIGFVATLIVGILGFIPGFIGGCIVSLGKETYRANNSNKNEIEHISYLGSSIIGVIIGTFILIIL